MSDQNNQIHIDIVGDSDKFDAAAQKAGGAMDRLGSGATKSAEATRSAFSGARQAVVHEAAQIVGASEAGEFSLLRLSGPALALTSIIGTMAKAYADGRAEMQAMDLALAKTGDFAGQTRDGLRQLGIEMAEHSEFTVGHAKEISTALAASGRIGEEAFRKVGMVAADFARVMGVETGRIAPELIKLFDDPTKGAEELNKTLHFLTATEYEQIRALEEMGRAGEAQAMLADRLKEKLDAINSRVAHQVSLWQQVKQAGSEAWDWMSGLGRDSTAEERLRELEQKSAPGRGVFSVLSAEEKAEMEHLRTVVADRAAASKAMAAQASRDTENIRALEIIGKNSISAQAAAIDRKVTAVRAFEPETIEQANQQHEAVKKLLDARAKLFETKEPKEDFSRVDISQRMQHAADRELAEIQRQMLHDLAEKERVLRKVDAAETAVNETVERAQEGNAKRVSDIRLEVEMLGKSAAERAKLAEFRKIDMQMQRDVEKVTDRLGKVGDVEKVTDRLGKVGDAAVGKLQQDAEKTKDAWVRAYDEMDARGKDWLAGARDGLQAYDDHVSRSAANMATSFSRGAQMAEDALAQFAVTGKLNIDSLLQYAAVETARRNFAQPVVGAISSWGQGLFSGGGGSSGSSLMPGEWDYMDWSKSFDWGSIGVPSFDVGTDRVPRDMLAFIHEGERITPKEYNPAIGNGGGVQVNVYNNASGTQATATSRTGSDGREILDVVVERVEGKFLNQMRYGGPMRSAVMSATGARG